MEADPQDLAGDGVEPLVMAMPRRELFRLGGFTTAVDLEVISSLAEESFFTVPSALEGSLEAKEVRIGLVVDDGERVLATIHGGIVHIAPLTPDIAGFGRGLVALRTLARAAGDALLGSSRGRVELAGYANDEALPDIRPWFILVYRYRPSASGIPAPDGMSWLTRAQIATEPLDSLSVLVAGGLLSGTHRLSSPTSPTSPGS